MRWADALRSAPAGVVAIAGGVSLVAAGLLAGGAYLALSEADAGWAPFVAALLAGPALLYFAAHLLRRSSWAWPALIAFAILLLASSIGRAVILHDAVVAPLVEMVFECALLYYLTRPGVRRAFGRA